MKSSLQLAFTFVISCFSLSVFSLPANAPINTYLDNRLFDAYKAHVKGALDLAPIRARADKCKTDKTIDNKASNWLEQPLPVQEKIVDCQLAITLAPGTALTLFRSTPKKLDDKSIMQAREQGIRTARIVIQKRLNQLSKQQIKNKKTNASLTAYAQQKQVAESKLTSMSIEEFTLAQPIFCQRTSSADCQAFRVEHQNRQQALFSYLSDSNVRSSFVKQNCAKRNQHPILCKTAEDAALEAQKNEVNKLDDLAFFKQFEHCNQYKAKGCEVYRSGLGKQRITSYSTKLEQTSSLNELEILVNSNPGRCNNGLCQAQRKALAQKSKAVLKGRLMDQKYDWKTDYNRCQSEHQKLKTANDRAALKAFKKGHHCSIVKKVANKRDPRNARSLSRWSHQI